MNRSLFTKSRRAQVICGLLIAIATAALTSCHSDTYLAYKFPQYTFADRPVPPSKLANRVMVGVTLNGSSTGSLQILDALRDIRNNIENTVSSFSISGYSSGYPNLILSFPAEVTGYVYSNTLGDVQIVSYSKESVIGAAGTFPAKSTGLAIPPTFGHIYSAEESIGQLGIIDNSTGRTFGLNLPNVYQVVVNTGDTVVLAMVRNSNKVYRVVKLNVSQGQPGSFPTSTAAIAATGAVDCEPFNLPVYCVVPVNTGSAANAFDRPTNAYFSLDGNYAYVLNCGAECGGQNSSVTFLQQGVLEFNNIPTAIPDANSFTTQVPVPGGVTAALSDGTTLYVSGQQLQPDGLFAGNLSTINLATALTSPAKAVTGQYSISDGTHTKMLFADNNSLWIGSQLCATGERAKRASEGITDQTANYNCLTEVFLPAAGTTGGLTANIVPAVSQNPSATVTVPYPNTNQNQFYYGDLTGLCWVQGLGKVYTAYGGQVHAFNTADGSEINNVNIIVQGTALDVAYLDAVTDAAN